MHALSNYNGTNILIATPESDLSADQQALNNNFKNIVTGYVPYTGATEDVNLGSNGLEAGAAQLTSVVVTTASGSISIGPNAGSGANGSIFPAPPVGISLNAGAADSDFLVQPPQTLGDGIAVASVNDANSANLSIEFRATQYLFSDPSDGNPSLYVSTALVGGAWVGVLTTNWDGVSALLVDGPASLDSGAITSDGLGTICLHQQSSPPTAVAGGIYFDGTHFNFCADGSTWVSLTLP